VADERFYYVLSNSVSTLRGVSDEIMSAVLNSMTDGTSSSASTSWR
jgi:hypothetical protein